MALLEGKTPAERYKTIAAIVLGVIALIVVARWLLGSSTPTANKASTTNSKGPKTPTGTRPRTAGHADINAPDPSLVVPEPIPINIIAPGAPAPTRNIFAFYVPPTPPASTAPVATEVAPSPTPPLMLASLSPANVYAQTGEFTLQVAGDKFTPEARVFVENQELPTKFISAQQLQASVPAALLAYVGARQVIVRTVDGQLYSNIATINVEQPPAPPYTFIGVLLRQGREVALLKDQKGELLNVQRGDLLNSRFRINSISERTVEFVDTQLKIKHTMPFTDPQSAAGNKPLPQYPVETIPYVEPVHPEDEGVDNSEQQPVEP